MSVGQNYDRIISPQEFIGMVVFKYKVISPWKEKRSSNHDYAWTFSSKLSAAKRLINSKGKRVPPSPSAVKLHKTAQKQTTSIPQSIMSFSLV